MYIYYSFFFYRSVQKNDFFSSLNKKIFDPPSSVRGEKNDRQNATQPFTCNTIKTSNEY